MPKTRESPIERMNRAFLAALRYGQTLLGEKDSDTANKMKLSGYRTYYRNLKDVENFKLGDARIIAQRYFTDRQLCEAFGVEYHGSTQT